MIVLLVVIGWVRYYDFYFNEKAAEVVPENTAPQAETAPTLPLVTAHVVKKGQGLGTIARDWAPDGTSGLDLVALNEAVLAPAFVWRCGDLSKAFRTREKIDTTRWQRGGGTFFCNDNKGNANFPAWANSLVPGDIIYVPTGVSQDSAQAILGETAKDINSAVAGLTGKKIVLVVDVSGSMDDGIDRTKVANLYDSLLPERIIGIVAFSEKAVVVKDLNTYADVGGGGTENVGAALLFAAKLGADEIVLIGDEPGDDLTGFSEFTYLPPVTAHCLPEADFAACRDAFSKIANNTNGRYVE